MTVPESAGGKMPGKLERERIYREAKERVAERLRKIGEDKMAERLTTSKSKPKAVVECRTR